MEKKEMFAAMFGGGMGGMGGMGMGPADFMGGGFMGGMGPMFFIDSDEDEDLFVIPSLSFLFVLSKPIYGVLYQTHPRKYQ